MSISNYCVDATSITTILFSVFISRSASLAKVFFSSMKCVYSAYSVPGHNGATHRYQNIAALIQGSAATTETDDNYHTACGYHDVGQTM